MGLMGSMPVANGEDCCEGQGWEVWRGNAGGPDPSADLNTGHVLWRLLCEDLGNEGHR